MGQQSRRAASQAVEALSLKAGDQLEIVDVTRERLALAKDERRKRALERLASTRLTLPTGYKFDWTNSTGKRPTSVHGAMPYRPTA